MNEGDLITGFIVTLFLVGFVIGLIAVLHACGVL